MRRANSNLQMSSVVVDNLVHLSIVEGENIYYYRGSEKKYPFIKVSGSILALNKAKQELKTGGISFGLGPVQVGTLFEANIDAEVKFMARTGIVGCGWVEIPVGKGTILNKKAQSSRCQLEVEVKLQDLIVHDPEGEWGAVAPIRTLSFDIECMGRRGVFPDANEDPVIQIANMVKVSFPSLAVFFLISWCQLEVEVKLQDLIVHDPEGEWGAVAPIRTLSFDIECMGRRGVFPDANEDPVIQIANMVKVEGESEPFIRNCFVLGSCAPIIGSDIIQCESEKDLLEKWSEFVREVDPDILTGYNILNFDLPYILDRAKVLKLPSVAMLGRQRNRASGVRDAAISSKQMGSRVNKSIDIHGRVIFDVLQILSMMLRKCKANNFFLPVIEVQGGDSEGYEGATVIEPLRGFYNEPIATLDFASLYPSIMIAHNLCYTTLLKKPEGEEGKDYIRTPSGNFFVTKERRRGLLPVILEDLLAARKRAKNEMKHEKDEFRKMVLNGRQLALKISANSVYGFTGAVVGKLPCLEISQSVTAFGRQMIDLTKSEVEKRYTAGALDGKCPTDAQVIYGDTDSVMVKFGVKTVAEAMEIGLHAATEVSKIFTPPIKLEFEKVYFPYLLINKKRYAGLYFTKPDKHDKMDCKGLETVRRDNCPLVAKVLNTCLEKLLIARDATSALEFAKRVISDLLCNKIDISLLIISKELTKSGDVIAFPHRSISRSTGPTSTCGIGWLGCENGIQDQQPRLGDRVPYVFIASAKNVPAYEKAEDPTFVLKNNIPIDTKHYLTNQLAKPLARIFEPILGDRAERV
ncbi:DNA polymerase family B, partial [Ostertagia ostertagi]